MFDVELFIDAVKERPALYNPSHKLFHRKENRARLWEEIGQVMFPDWPNLNPRERFGKGLLMQKKWKSLKDCFNRELRVQKIHGYNPKRKQYEFYNRLLFLLNRRYSYQESPQEKIDTEEVRIKIETPEDVQLLTELSCDQSPLQEPPHSQQNQSPLKESPHNHQNRSLLKEPPHSQHRESLFQEPPQSQQHQPLLQEPPHSQQHQPLLQEPPHSQQHQPLLQEPPHSQQHQPLLQEPPHSQQPSQKKIALDVENVRDTRKSLMKKSGAEDSDRLFLMSFVRDLNKLPLSTKYWVKMKFSEIMHQATMNLVELQKTDFEDKNGDIECLS